MNSTEIKINSETLTLSKDENLFEGARNEGIVISSSCSGQGKCRECIIEVMEGDEFLSERVPEERDLLSNFRLSCCTRIARCGGKISCRTLKKSAMKINNGHSEWAELRSLFSPESPVKKIEDKVFRNGEKIGQTSGPINGIALDIGTTTVALRAIDLETGEILATRSFENPQRFGGSDIMARIRYDSVNRGRLMQRTLLRTLGDVILSLPVPSHTIYEIAVAGNSTMRDMFFGIPVESIGQKPYRSKIENEFREGRRESTSLSIPARRLRLPVHPEAIVYGLPLIGSHVGADTAAGLLAMMMKHRNGDFILMDIGTNTELVFGRGGEISVASCPAGPAFEGGEIACGMPGLEGAVEKVAINSDGTVSLEVIGEGKAEGICGSGLVDVLGEMLRTDRMNHLGRFSDEQEKFYLSREENIYFTEKDMNQLAQAKGANVAGLHVMSEKTGIPLEEVDNFYLAGGFAGYLNLENARRIGLIPDLPEHKITRMGNASLDGASLALLSKPLRNKLERTVKKIKHVELETHPLFFEFFTEGCLFQPVQKVEFAWL